MKKSIKAALWSGLAFPGAGHFMLKRYARGMLLFVPTVVALIYVVNDLLRKTAALAEKILSGAASADVTSITALVSADSSTSTISEIAVYVLLVCWIAGIIDSYRIGSVDDKDDEKTI
jgi:hypothetical protein